MTDPAQQLEWFQQAVALLGGPRRAADAIGIAERTVVAIRGGDRSLGPGVLGKTREALDVRAMSCTHLSRAIAASLADAR